MMKQDNLARAFDAVTPVAPKSAQIIALFAPVSRNEMIRREQLARQLAMAAEIRSKTITVTTADTKMQHQPKVW